MIKPQRLHREPDPRVRRSFAAALALSAVLVVVALLLVGLRVQQVHLAYRLDALRAERARTETLIRQLEIEVATLRSPVRVDQRARQLGLTAPAPDQVRLARAVEEAHRVHQRQPPVHVDRAGLFAKRLIDWRYRWRGVRLSDMPPGTDEVQQHAAQKEQTAERHRQGDRPQRHFPNLSGIALFQQKSRVEPQSP